MFLENDFTDELPVTAVAHRTLAQDLEKLRHEKAQFTEQLRMVRQFGDTANNDEYLALREEEAVLDARLARLEDTLSRVRVVDPADTPDVVAIGSSVTVLDRVRGGTFDYVIDGAHAAVAPGAVSAVSPVGRALLGRKAGEVVMVELPRKGHTRELEVVAVSQPALP